jgi:hypothetical protein
MSEQAVTDVGRVRTMTREQIMALFDSYQFKDALGHDLLRCVDFEVLLDEAMWGRALAGIKQAMVDALNKVVETA